MREIKFRAYRGGEMLTQPISGVFGMYRLLGLLDEDTELMQYTGIKNAMEVEIWEGDKLSFVVFDCFDNDSQFEGYVVYNGSRFMVWNKIDDPYYKDDGAFDLDWLVSQDDELKIIGNIHEHKHLLETNND